ncbi:MAG: class I SAM-dependent methyltransferase [Planctomycetota bacterium]
MGIVRRLTRSPHIRGDVAERFGRHLSSGRILDLPAGSGVNSRPLQIAGYRVQAADIFPDPCRAASPDVPCDAVDMTRPLPYSDDAFDGVLHSEGIEHVDAQIELLSEFHRVLRPGGVLIVTTPNLLHLEGRVSMFLSGHVHPRRAMVVANAAYWGAKRTGDGRCYFGHVFLINHFQLRFYLTHVGFEIVEVDTTRYSWKSLLLTPFLWPFVAASTRRLLRRRVNFVPPTLQRQLAREVLGPAVLFGRKLIVVARKPERATCL